MARTIFHGFPQHNLCLMRIICLYILLFWHITPLPIIWGEVDLNFSFCFEDCFKKPVNYFIILI